MSLTITALQRVSMGDKVGVFGSVAFDSSYPNTGATIGEPLTPAAFGLSAIEGVFIENPSAGGYNIIYDKAKATMRVYYPLPTHAHTVGTSAAGASHNHVFTGSALGTHQHAAITAGTPSGTVTGTALDLATPAFSGTGLTASGQVMTTTDTHTMTLNQCAGMWLIPATGSTAPMLILSNTAVSGAAAVLTVQGSAATDAGAYKIVKAAAPTFTGAEMGTHQHAAITAGTPAGTNAAEATHTHAAGAVGTSTAAVGAEVADTANLSALTGVRVFCVGY